LSCQLSDLEGHAAVAATNVEDTFVGLRIQECEKLSREPLLPLRMAGIIGGIPLMN
jgi:hypothetical protein